MKIKITENQLNVIKSRINEDVNIVSNFENFCKEKAVELNKLYSKISMVSVAELINNEIDIKKLIDYLWDLENTELRNKRNMAYDFFKNFQDDEYFGLESRVDNANSFVVSKIDSLNLILEPLYKLQNDFENNQASKAFSDVKPIDITPYQG